MWTKKNRRRYERRGLRYESDLTDEEYALIEHFLPAERSISRRSLVNGILYILHRVPMTPATQGLSTQKHDA